MSATNEDILNAIKELTKNTTKNFDGVGGYFDRTINRLDSIEGKMVRIEQKLLNLSQSIADFREEIRS